MIITLTRRPTAATLSRDKARKLKFNINGRARGDQSIAFPRKCGIIHASGV